MIKFAKKQRYRVAAGLVILGVAIFFTRGFFNLSPFYSSEVAITSCGAKADDKMDDYEAITACIALAKNEGKKVYVPEGNFLVSDIITLNGVSMTGAGPDSSIITSTNPEKGSIDIEGDNVTLSELQHVYQTVIPRGDGANEKNSITVRGATHFRIEHVYVQKASTAGILVMDKSSNGSIISNKIEHTGADGIHVTDGSSQINIQNNIVKKVGDDTIAVVSYLEDGAVVNNVHIRGNDVGYDSQARGISVVGGEDVIIEDNSIQETQMAGIYISVEEEWQTWNTARVTVNRNKVSNTGIKQHSDHPNVLLYASRGKIDEITFNENRIENSTHSGIGIWGDGEIGNVYFNSNTLIASSKASTVFKKGNIHLKENYGF